MVPADLFAYQTARIDEGVIVTTAGRELACFHAACRAAAVNGRVPSHPFLRLDRTMRETLMPQAEPKGREIPDGEFEAVMEHLLPMYKPVMYFIRASGVGRGDALDLTWANVTKTHVLIPAPRKRRPPYRILLAALPDDLQRFLRFPGKGLVFDITEGGLGSAWDRARKKAGSTARIHEVGKHSLITRMGRAGKPAEAISAATGTLASTITKWYLHAEEERGDAAYLALVDAKAPHVGHTKKHA